MRSFCCGSLLTVSVTSHLMFADIIFCSVWVAEWLPFGKELLTRLTKCSLYVLTICSFSISSLGFEGQIWDLIGSSSLVSAYLLPIIMKTGNCTK